MLKKVPVPMRNRWPRVQARTYIFVSNQSYKSGTDDEEHTSQNTRQHTNISFLSAFFIFHALNFPHSLFIFPHSLFIFGLACTAQLTALSLAFIFFFWAGGRGGVFIF